MQGVWLPHQASPMQRLVRIGGHWIFSADADEPHPKHEVLGGSRGAQPEAAEVGPTNRALHRAEKLSQRLATPDHHWFPVPSE